MANITIKNIPEDLLEALRLISEEENRSLNRQIIQLLGEAVANRGFGEGRASDPGQQVREQVAAWRSIAGDWAADLDAPKRRGRGRKADL